MEPKEKRIEIEKMPFGDYRVQVLDESSNLIFDREYLCRGIVSASTTAKTLKIDYFQNLEIYYRSGDLVHPLSTENL